MVPKMKLIKLSPPEVRKHDTRTVSRAIRQGQLSQGKYIKNFENALSSYLGSTYVSTVSSCTTGLQLILSALKLKADDEVIVPNFTFPATINAVIQERLTPVLVDIETSTYCMAIDSLERAIGEKTKAIIVVHAFGHPANMTEIVELASRHNIFVIEDAACAIGSRINGSPVGNHGIASSFSFHPRKVLTTGEGGAVTTNNKELAEAMQILRSHGGIRGEVHMTFVTPGFNFRMSDLNAALGMPQLKRLQGTIRGRNRVAKVYSQFLSRLEGVVIPKTKMGFEHTFQSYIIKLPKWVNRNDVAMKMRELGVETAIGTYALSKQPAYKELAKTPVDLEHSEAAYEQTIALPIHSRMPTWRVKKVAQVLETALIEERTKQKLSTAI